MKNIHGFALLVSIVCLLFPPHARAENPPKPFPYTFSAASAGGILYGAGEEIVYKTGNTYLSQLLWDMKPLFYLGTDIGFSRSNPLEGPGVMLGLSMKFGLPGETGVMEDRDWQSGADNRLTNFSSHENKTQGAFIFDVTAGATLPVASRLVLGFYLGFSYMRFSWAAENGYYQYESTQWAEIPLYGPAISYSQTWFIFFPGVSLKAPFLKLFSCTLSFAATPLLFGFAEDDHFMRRLRFQDRLEHLGLFLEPEISFAVSPRPRLDIALSVSYRYLGYARGASRVQDTDPAGNGAYEDAGSAGAGFSALDAGLSVKIRF
ncbi:MAG: omptin family outer membrane protease [Spirochaetaceae bacterium]|jgi:outer membrane protease|nr:omptin family outer membrane protease [Spirochaetaceae bacterium]